VEIDTVDLDEAVKTGCHDKRAVSRLCLVCWVYWLRWICRVCWVGRVNELNRTNHVLVRIIRTDLPDFFFTDDRFMFLNGLFACIPSLMKVGIDWHLHDSVRVAFNACFADVSDIDFLQVLYLSEDHAEILDCNFASFIPNEQEESCILDL
jgi:hypothetical protein